MTFIARGGVRWCWVGVVWGSGFERCFAELVGSLVTVVRDYGSVV